MDPADPPVLVLASASPARLATLRSAGLDPRVVVSGVDEPAELVRARAAYGDLAPADVALVLARAKAEAVVALLGREDGARAAVEEPATSAPVQGGAEEPVPLLDDVLVLGCDSVLELDGEVHGKPADAAEARARWARMSGRSGVLHTGHWVVDTREPGDGGSGATLGATASTTVHFVAVGGDEVEAYVATGEPLHVAGAFTLDGLGGAFVRAVEGDPHNVVGVSLPLLRDLLADCGVRWTDLWQRAR